MKKLYLFLVLIPLFTYSFGQTYPADNDHEFDDGSKIVLPEEITDDLKNNLSLLCKVWGFVKYYHPESAKGNFDMDYELFRIMPTVLEATNKEEFNNAIAGWLEKIGDPGEAGPGIPSDWEIKREPDFSWMNSNNFPETILDELDKIKEAKRSNTHYYLSVGAASNLVFEHEKPYENLKYPDDGFRLLTLFRYWNMVEYNFPYKYLTDVPWDEVIDKFIPLFISSKDESEYKYNILRLIAHINDSHGFLAAYDPVLYAYRGYGAYSIPVEVKYIENKVVVTNYTNNLGKQTGLEIGDVIESVDGVVVEDYIKEKMPVFSASNEAAGIRDILYYILYTNKNSMDLTYTRMGKTYSKKIDCYTPYFNLPTPDFYQIITPDISYLNLETIPNYYYLLMYANEILQRKGLIIDMRCYPDYQSIAYLAHYLMEKPTPFIKFSSSSISYPGVFNMSSPLITGSNNPDYYKGKVVILVNEESQSRPEYATMMLRVAPNATVVGSTTTGADGDISYVTLPGNIQTLFTGVGVYYPDGGETQRVGLKPDVIVKPTIEGIRTGRDELLEEAIRIINGETSVHPETYISDNQFTIYTHNNELIIRNDSDNNETTYIKLYSADGKLILSESFTGNEKSFYLDVPKGNVFILKVETNSMAETRKIMF